MGERFVSTREETQSELCHVLLECGKPQACWLHIHYLQIDTEGYDAEIIKSIDISRVNIDIIKYETWNFAEDCFSRRGDKAKLYGVNGMNYISNLLLSLDYELTKDGGDMIAVKKRLR